MKIGKEVEGAYQGSMSVFIPHFELKDALARWDELWHQYGVEHLYISDHGNALTEADLRLIEDFMSADESLIRVTIEVLSLPHLERRVPEISYMVAIELDPRFLGFAFPQSNLIEGDQVKFTKNLFVACAKATDFVITQPGCFADDVEV